MRIKFLRILPDTCASTWCLFSSSTLNMALGSGSRTTAITSIASSLLIRSLKSAFSSWLLAKSQELKALSRQNYRPVFSHRHAMLEVRAETAVDRHCRPLITEHSRFRLAVVHHRLDGEHHTFAQLCAMTACSEVRNLRLFVQARPNAMSH